jgi:hypothetical protein
MRALPNDHPTAVSAQTAGAMSALTAGGAVEDR